MFWLSSSNLLVGIYALPTLKIILITRLLHLVLLAISLIALTESAAWLLKQGMLGEILMIPVIVTGLITFLMFLGYLSHLLRIAVAVLRKRTDIEQESQAIAAKTIDEWIEIRTGHYGIGYLGHFTLIGPPEIRQRLKDLLSRCDSIPQYNQAIHVASKHVKGFLYEPFFYVRKKVDFGWVAFSQKTLEDWEDKPRRLMWHMLFTAVRARLRRRGIVISRSLKRAGA